MIISPEQAPEWTAEDAAVFSEFIASPVGQRLLAVLAYDRQSGLEDKDDAAARLARYDKIAGYDRAVESLLLLRRAIPKPEQADPIGLLTPTSYPSLDDDSQWPSPSKTSR